MEDKKKDFDKEAASWDKNSERVRIPNEIADFMLKEIKLSPEQDVLDFGCGTGLVTLRIQPFVHTITGVDNSQGMIDALKTKIQEQNLSNVKTLFLNSETKTLLKGKYHLIISCLTFHHIKDIQSVLAQFASVLVPGGTLAIADLDLDDGMFHGDNTGVFHFGFDRSALSQELLNAGFEHIQAKTAIETRSPISTDKNRLFSIFLMTGKKTNFRT